MNNIVASCIVCGIKGRGSKDFICEGCGNPQKNILNCNNCRVNFELTDAELDEIRAMVLPLVIPESSGGIVIITDFCSECGGIRGKVRVHKLRT
jgi:hypothetical protein